MKKIALVLIFFVSNAYAFLGFFEKERPDPLKLKTEAEQMQYLKDYLPDSYERVLKYKRYLTEIKEIETELESDDEWKEYSKYSSQVINLDEEKAKEFRRKVEEKKALEKKAKEVEKAILAKYKVVNGKLVNRKDEKDAETKRKEEELLRKRIIEFQKKNNLPVLKDGQLINVKKE